MHKRIAFMGSDAIAIPMLDYLYGLHDQELRFSGVFSQPDRPAGRGKHLRPNPVSQWAMAHDVELMRPQKPGEVELNWIKREKIDLVLVMAYGHIIREPLLQAPREGMVNFHASLLPKYRGASPIETAIAAGESQTGVSLMRMVKRMDAGAVLDQQSVPIGPADTGQIVRERMGMACVPLIERNLRKLLNGVGEFEQQDESKVSYCRKIEKADGHIDFEAPAAEIYNRFRAFKQWPGAFFEHQGVTLKVGDCEALERKPTVDPGLIEGITEDGVEVATGSGVLIVKDLQRPGGKHLPVAEFLRGYPMAVGESLHGKPYRPLVGATVRFE